MPYDSDETEDAMLDYIGEHETGFIPGTMRGPEIISMDEAVRRLVFDLDTEDEDRD